MDLVVELPVLVSDGWFEEVSRRAAATPELADVTLTELRPPMGGMGADLVPRLKVAYDATKDVVGLVAALVAIATTIHGGATSGKTCTFRMTDGSQKIELTVPCDEVPGKDFVDGVSRFVANTPEGELTVRLMPRMDP
jgi:hypothetical protein